MMRLVDAVDLTLRKEQAGFRRGRGTIEHIFTLRNILEQCNEWQRKIYINFVDLEKEFDSVHRDSLWRILRHYGVPQKVTSIISLLYSDYTCCVQNSSLRFSVNSGVRQGCVMSAFLFIMAIDWLMKTVTEQKQTGIRWSLFSVLEDLEFADDIALPSHTWTHTQQKSSRLNDRASTIGLRINADKTKVMSSDPRRQPVIINSKALDYVDKFTYLGSILSLHDIEDITSPLGKARSAFFRLPSVWKSNNYSRKTKLRLYQSNVLSVLLYGSECWRMTERDSSRLAAFHTTCLRRIMRVFWPNKISNSRLLQLTKQEPMGSILKRRRWRWFGHTLRMDAGVYARTAPTWAPEGTRKRGRPRTSWRRTISEELKKAGIAWVEAERLATDRVAWRDLVEASCAT